MNQEQKIDDLEQKIDAQNQVLQNIYSSTEKTRKYFMWSLIITVVFLVLPLIAMVFVLPMAISSYTGALNLGI